MSTERLPGRPAARLRERSLSESAARRLHQTQSGCGGCRCCCRSAASSLRLARRAPSVSPPEPAGARPPCYCTMQLCALMNPAGLISVPLACGCRVASARPAQWRSNWPSNWIMQMAPARSAQGDSKLAFKNRDLRPGEGELARTTGRLCAKFTPPKQSRTNQTKSPFSFSWPPLILELDLARPLNLAPSCWQ